MQLADHLQEIEKAEKKGGRVPADLVKLAKIAIPPIFGKGLAEVSKVGSGFLRILDFLRRYAEVKGNPGSPEISVTAISLSSPAFSEIQLVTRLHYS